MPGLGRPAAGGGSSARGRPVRGVVHDLLGSGSASAVHRHAADRGTGPGQPLQSGARCAGRLCRRDPCPCSQAIGLLANRTPSPATSGEPTSTRRRTAKPCQDDVRGDDQVPRVTNRPEVVPPAQPPLCLTADLSTQPRGVGSRIAWPLMELRLDDAVSVPRLLATRVPQAPVETASRPPSGLSLNTWTPAPGTSSARA